MLHLTLHTVQCVDINNDFDFLFLLFKIVLQFESQLL